MKGEQETHNYCHNKRIDDNSTLVTYSFFKYWYMVCVLTA